MNHCVYSFHEKYELIAFRTQQRNSQFEFLCCVNIRLPAVVVFENRAFARVFLFTAIFKLHV